MLHSVVDAQRLALGQRDIPGQCHSAVPIGGPSTLEQVGAED